MTLGANQIAEEVAAFAERMTPAKPRWCYALDRITHGNGRNERSIPTLARFLGVSTERAGLRLQSMTRNGGFDGAVDWYEQRLPEIVDPFAVGPIQPWQIGHVYFLRPFRFPHIVKIGFSRRVSDRVADIESKVHQRLELQSTKVGTLADEQWWHRNWRDYRIDGEWFFDPRCPERELPPFLVKAHADAEGMSA